MDELKKKNDVEENEFSDQESDLEANVSNIEVDPDSSEEISMEDESSLEIDEEEIEIIEAVEEDLDPVEPPDPALIGMLEAVLFVTDDPINEVTLSKCIPDLLEAQVEMLIDMLEDHYIDHGHGLTVQRVAGGWRLSTRVEYSDIVKSLLRGKIRAKLSRQSLETVSIIAYKQPVSRSEIEAMRGVDCSPVLRHLLERGLIKVNGRAEAPGRPLLYGTSEAFLEYFGLEKLSSLPKPEEILDEREEGQSGSSVHVQMGPFVGTDSGVEEEIYRSEDMISHEEPEENKEDDLD
jgi:segregation and condensation protein B